MSRKNKGFTLVEMLCTIVVLLLVSAAVTAGIRLAVSNYSVSITASESQVLCSTVLDSVSDELRYCTVEDWQADNLKFVSARYVGIRHFEVSDGRILVVPEEENEEISMTTENLLPKKSYVNGMKAQLELTPNEEEGIVRVTVRITDAAGKVLQERFRDVEILSTLGS